MFCLTLINIPHRFKWSAETLYKDDVIITSFPSTDPPWYVDWYMIIIYSLVVWALLIPIFIIWWFYSKKKYTKHLPPPDPWLGN